MDNVMTLFSIGRKSSSVPVKNVINLAAVALVLFHYQLMLHIHMSEAVVIICLFLEHMM